MKRFLFGLMAFALPYHSSVADILLSASFAEHFPSFSSSMQVNNGSDFDPPFNQDRYSTQAEAQPALSLELAKRQTLTHTFLSAYSLGLQYQHLFSTNLGQTVMQYSDPEFTNYSYTWHEASDTLMAKAKVSFFNYHNFTPFAALGLGLALNQSGAYEETALAGLTAERLSPAFARHCAAEFTYSLGAGLDYSYSQHFSYFAQYQFQDLGPMRSGNGQGDWIGSNLSLGRYQTQAIVLGLTYAL